MTAVAVAIFVVLIIPALSQQQQQQNPSDQQRKSSLKVAVVTDALFSDRGWGESSLNAAKQIERKYGFEVATQDNVEIPDIESVLEKYADAGYDLIIAHGVQWGEPALSVGRQHPDVKIVVFAGLVKSENVASIFPMQQEGSFLLGAIAGMMTKTNVIGYVGGEEYPSVINILEGYKQGAKTVNPDVRIIWTYLNDWDNPAKGKEAATSIIRQKADVIFHVADTSGHGVIQAAKENGGVYALGAVQDQNSLAPDTVLSSFILDVDKAYDQAVDSVVKGDFKGEIYKSGIETGKGAPGDGIVYLAPFHGLKDKVPENVNARLQELLADVLEKRLVVPERLEETTTVAGRI
ncbi:BMP family lipoprotein [Nitrososphaera viennensis]|uniref:BMP family protein n=1 Tax=Nitrososphaera viennensis TaxID=1034015 RepID=A0A977IF50_9ARCH|nr:BMP family protein [Nitrososphaera viennensis]UVS69886.1 BMP family protein [Nitrososphaera viennensis]